MKKVSVLLPTRNRYDMFVRSVQSLANNCSSTDNIEILVAVDYDDEHTTKRIEDYRQDKPYIKVFYYERHRYRGLHLYMNDLAIKAVDGSLMLWNDDATMLSRNWDLEILKHHEKFCVINPKVENMEHYWRHLGVLFPIIPKKWIELVGTWSPTPGLDSWADVISKRLGILVSVESIVIFHDRHELTGNNNDQTYAESYEDKHTPSLHHGYEVWSHSHLLNEHCAILSNYLNEIKNK